MPRNLIASDATIRASKARRLSDGEGLYLITIPSGSRAWRFDYRYAGKDRTLSMGRYPDVGLAAARRSAEVARSQVAACTDPSAIRKEHRAKVAVQVENERLAADGKSPIGSFGHLADEYIAMRSTAKAGRPARWSASYTEGWVGRLGRHVYPYIGKMPIVDVGPIHLLEVLRKIEDQGLTDTAQKVFQMIGEVMRYAVASQRIPSDPSRDLRGALAGHTVRHLPTILEPKAVGQLVRDIRRYRGTATIRAAAAFALLVFQRTHMLRAMRWTDVDLEAGLWTIPSHGMKRTTAEKLNGTAHLVPLSRQACELLRSQQLISGDREWVFPATHNRSGFSENTLNHALASMGYRDQLTGHGFRAMARTLMVELDPTLGEVLEAQLAHKKSGALGAAYDRAQYLVLRREVMQRWADYLDRLAQD